MFVLWLLWGLVYVVGDVWVGGRPFYWQGLVGNHNYVPPLVPGTPDPRFDIDNLPGGTYWYCNDTGPLSPHHNGFRTAGDHLCTIGELKSLGLPWSIPTG